MFEDTIIEFSKSLIQNDRMSENSKTQALDSEIKRLGDCVSNAQA